MMNLASDPGWNEKPKNHWNGGLARDPGEDMTRNTTPQIADQPKKLGCFFENTWSVYGFQFEGVTAALSSSAGTHESIGPPT